MANEYESKSDIDIGENVNETHQLRLRVVSEIAMVTPLATPWVSCLARSNGIKAFPGLPAHRTYPQIWQNQRD
jgi:hypothetical protein